MKILLLSQFFSTTRGGGEYVFNLIAKNLAKNNHKVFVITNKILNEQYDEFENIKLIFVPPTLEYKGGLPPGFLDNIRYSFNTIKEGLKIIKKERIDVIHSNNFAPALAGSILTSLTSKPHITTMHDVFSLCGNNYWKMWGAQADVSKINVMLAPYFEKLLIKLKQSAIHTVSEATKDDLIKFGVKKPIHVIHNSIEYDSNHNITESNPLQFVYVGRLVFYKNLEVVIKALEIAKKSSPEIKLIVIGSGPHKKNLQELSKKMGLESNIEFKGYVSPEEKESIIANSIALVFPSLCEGFGLVMLEAFAKNIPVLVSDMRPMSDIVEHGSTGYVLDPHDENLWAKYFLKIIQNPGEAKTLGKNGNYLLTSTYSQDSMCKKIIEMYSKYVVE